MLNCREVAERASALIDGELGMFKLLQMHLHLAMCKGCNAFVRQLRTTHDLALSAVVTDDDHLDRVDENITAILSEPHDRKKASR